MKFGIHRSFPADCGTDKEGIVLFCLPAEGRSVGCVVPAAGESSCGEGADPGLLQVCCLRRAAASELGMYQYLEYTSYLLQAGVAFPPQVKLKLLLRPYPPPISAD